MIALLTALAAAGIIAMFAYMLGMWLEARVTEPLTGGWPLSMDNTLVVFAVPCLNEERVIEETLARLRSVPIPNFVVLVIDDGSDDHTAELVNASSFPELTLFRRRLPEARGGKGAALNAGIRWLLDSGRIDEWDPANVIVCILDADGRLEVSGLPRVLREFEDPLVGGVQIGVRIVNRAHRVLLRLQDMEFVTYTRIFQVPRSRSGYAFLGGNGQFTRLSALLSLGDEPWSDSLTEDVDLGIRLVLQGWWTRFVPEVTVEQQGLTSIRRLVRQRSRWFQGALQTWRLIPRVSAMSPWRVIIEFVHALLSPALILVTTFMVLSFLTFLTGAVLSGEGRSLLLRPTVLVSWYVLTFFPALVLGLAYREGSGIGNVRLFALAHTFIVFAVTWVAAGWWATGRLIVGRRSWLKTERTPGYEMPPVLTPRPVLVHIETAEAPTSLLFLVRRMSADERAEALSV